MNLEIRVIEHDEELPQLLTGNFFHSRDLFRIMAATPGHRPMMAVAVDGDGNVVAHLLACIRRRGSWLPPYLFTQGRIYGEGCYAEGVNREVVFGQLLKAVTRKFRRSLCLYAEFSNMSQKMFGYKYFRENGYFPVSWQEVHNSLHSMHPKKRLSEEQIDQIESLRKAGVATRRITEEDEIEKVYVHFRNYNRMKPFRFMPPLRFFTALNEVAPARIYVTEYRGKTIGACLSIHTNDNAWMWYLASKRKSHLSKHPDLLTIWHAIEEANAEKCQHFYFMDAGLPLRKSSYRDFILSFGGKPVAKYRWFRVSIVWLNKVLSWIYRE